MADIDIIMAKFNELDAKLTNIASAIVTAPPEIIDSAELCKRLDISEKTMISWKRKKRIPFIRVDGTFRYNWPRVVDSLENKPPSKK